MRPIGSLDAGSVHNRVHLPILALNNTIAHIMNIWFIWFVCPQVGVVPIQQILAEEGLKTWAQGMTV